MSLKAILKGLVISALITVVCLTIAAVILYFSDIDERILSVVIYIGTAVSIITGSIITAKSSESKVLFNCLVMGLAYWCILCICTWLAKNTINMGYHFWTVTAGIIVCSVLGAITGRK